MANNQDLGFRMLGLHEHSIDLYRQLQRANGTINDLTDEIEGLNGRVTYFQNQVRTLTRDIAAEQHRGTIMQNHIANLVFFEFIF